VQISGPILKDRLWYRLSHEKIERQDPINISGSAPIITTKQTVASDQITWQASPRNKLAFRYEYDPKTVENYGVSSRIPPESSQMREFGGPTTSVTWTAAFSPRLLVESTIAYQDQTVNLLPQTTGIRGRALVNLAYPTLDYAQNFVTNWNTTEGSYYLTSRDHRQRFTAKTPCNV
jgi:hypothetical protein